MTAQINQRHPLSQQQIEINRRLEGIFQPFASNQPVVRLVGSLTETKMRTMGTVAILLILLLSPVSADDKLVSPELPDEMVGQWCLVDEAPGVSLYEKRQNCRSLIVEKRRLIFMGRVVCTFEDVQRFSKDFRIKGVCLACTRFG
jgi:hypothetical protein